MAEKYASACAGTGSGPQPQLAALLCVPLLWQRAPTLRGVGPQLVRSAAAALWTLPPRELVAALPGAAPASGGVASAAVVALGNLLEIAPAVLQVNRRAAYLTFRHAR